MTELDPKFISDNPLRLLEALRALARLPSIRAADDLVLTVSDPHFQEALLARASPRQFAAELLGQSRAEGEYEPGLLNSEGFDDVLRLLQQAGLLDRILFVPGMERFAPFTMDQRSPHHRFNVFEHTLLLMKKLRQHPHTLAMPPDRQALYLLAALLHDIGKRDPKTTQVKEDGTQSYHDHENSSAQVALLLAAKWQLPEEDASYVHKVVRHHMEPHSKGWGKHDSTLLRFQRAHPTCWQDIIIHAHMDSEAGGHPRPGNARYPQFIERTLEARKIADERAALGAPVLDGNLILQKFPELTPGPWMKWILQKLSEMRLENPQLDEADFALRVDQMKEQVLAMAEFQKYRR